MPIGGARAAIGFAGLVDGRPDAPGAREGRIASIGRAGRNPGTLDAVEVVVAGTAIVPGAGMIATAGAVGTHVHLLSPRITEASPASGVTTVIGREFGPVWALGVNSPWTLHHAFNAFYARPVNIGFLTRGSSSARPRSSKSWPTAGTRAARRRAGTTTSASCATRPS